MAGVHRATGNAVRFLAAALVLATLAMLARRQGSAEAAAGAADGAAAAAPDAPCSPTPACGPQIYDDLSPVPTVARAEACAGAGYLCAGLELRRRPLRVLRFADGRAPLRVAVLWPDLANRDQANRMQQGAVRGLRAWDGVPLEIVTELARAPGTDVVQRGRETPSGGRAVGRTSPLLRPRGQTVTGNSVQRPHPADGRPDFQVQFVPVTTSVEVGETSAIWGWDGGGTYDLRVSIIRLPMNRGNGGALLTDREVEAAAAHAMGHALGLPHSSSRADVMHPRNTARTPSADDLAAVRALYALPNGAEIVGER